MDASEEHGPLPAPEYTEDVVQIRALIRGVYERKQPAKLQELDHLLDKHHGQEHDIYLHVCRKYGEEPEVGVKSWARSRHVTSDVSGGQGEFMGHGEGKDSSTLKPITNDGPVSSTPILPQFLFLSGEPVQGDFTGVSSVVDARKRVARICGVPSNQVQFAGPTGILRDSDSLSVEVVTVCMLPKIEVEMGHHELPRIAFYGKTFTSGAALHLAIYADLHNREDCDVQIRMRRTPKLEGKDIVWAEGEITGSRVAQKNTYVFGFCWPRDGWPDDAVQEEHGMPDAVSGSSLWCHGDDEVVLDRRGGYGDGWEILDAAGMPRKKMVLPLLDGDHEAILSLVPALGLWG